jgi:hypothetical protein
MPNFIISGAALYKSSGNETQGIKKLIKRIVLIAAVLVFTFSGFVYSQSPERNEQLIYSILAFDGKDYSGTFCREDSDSIHLLANFSSFLSLKKTLVFYWPITDEWKTDPETLDVVMEGTLEISGRKDFMDIVPQMEYTYFNVQGVYETNWEAATGEDAHYEWNRYMDMVSKYWSEYSIYKMLKTAYDSELNDILGEITRLREQGKDYSFLSARFENTEEPLEPDVPDFYIVPPIEIQKGFVVNLPKGTYDIRVRDKDGRILSGSRKKLIVFENRRKDGIGFDIIPGDRWTRPVESNTPASVLYVNGEADLYVRPFFQNEYQDLNYTKLKNNSGYGNPNIIKWQKIRQIPAAVIELKYKINNGIKLIREEEFIVEQISETSLGYKIVPYDPEGKHSGRKASLRAFSIPLAKNDSQLSVRVMDGNGEYLSGSDRQIRVVPSPALPGFYLLLACIPVVFMLIILICRKIKKRS